MTMIWQEAPRARPDPYLDWEYRTRLDRAKERWCSVHIQVVPACEGDYLTNLCRLLDAVISGSLDEDNVGEGVFTIRMADDERVRLQNVIRDIKSGELSPPFDVEMWFFI